MTNYGAILAFNKQFLGGFSQETLQEKTKTPAHLPLHPDAFLIAEHIL